MRMISFLIGLLFLISSINSLFEIHMIPHSHMDPGWGWTVDEYYRMRVEKVYDNVHKSLLENELRTFVVCEIIFFKRWYTSKSVDIQNDMKKFIKEGRIEFVGAGWVMHDEANTFYQDQIDQLRLGLQYVKKEFGADVKTAWSLDPFGHSSGNVYVLSQLGYQQLVIDRIHYQEKSQRILEGNMEFIYRPFNNTNGKELFYHVLGYHYGDHVCEFCYSDNGGSFSAEEVERNAIDFVRRLNKEVRNGYKTKNVYMHLIGGDFHYMHSPTPFVRTQAIMDYLNTHEVDGEKIEISFSTPHKFFQRVKEEQAKLNLQYKIENDMDFFVYADKPYSYWSGYFASRPFLKGIIRKSSNVLITSSKILTDFFLNGMNIKSQSLETLHGLVANFQHHDAITGTSNDHVNNVFIEQGQKNITDVQKYLTSALNVIDVFKNQRDMKICMSNPIVDLGCENAFNISPGENNEMVVGIVNPLIDKQLLITIEFLDSPVMYEIDSLSTNLRKEIKSDFYCFRHEKFGYKYKCFLTFFYNFQMKNIIESFALKRTNTPVPILDQLPENKITFNSDFKKIKLLEYIPENYSFHLEIDQNGENKIYDFSLFHAKYIGHRGGNHEGVGKNADGMYIFTPLSHFPETFKINKEQSYVRKGKISSTIFVRYEETSYLAATFYYDPLFLKVDHFLDPINRANGFNYVFGIQSNIKNNISVQIENESQNVSRAEFWTDSNGMQMMRRVSGYISKYNHKFEESTAINFYPVSTSISIRERKDKFYFDNKYDSLTKNDKMITIFTDKPQSGGAINEGEIMLLIDRNSLSDDDKGIGQNLYERQSENTYFKISHIIMFGNTIFDNDQYGVSSLNFMYNYFHNPPFLVSSPGMEKFKSVKSEINKIFTFSENVVNTYQIIDDNTIIAQFYCSYDYYFMNQELSFCYTSVNADKLLNMDIQIDSNGFQSINSKPIENRKHFPEFFKKTNYDLYIRPNDFIFLYLYLKDNK